MDLYNQSKFVGQLLAMILFTHRLLQADVVFAREFARRYADKGIVSMSVHPGRPYLLASLCSLMNRWSGLIVTNLGRTMSPTVVKLVVCTFINDLPFSHSSIYQGYISYNSAQGALTQLWAATSPETADANGKVSAALLNLRPVLITNLIFST